MPARTARGRAGAAPTIADVAKAAGVSAMTVSRVINSDQSVRPATQARVRAAIGTLNYVPNTAARALAGAVRTRLAIVHGNPSAAFLSEVLVGALTETSRSDAQLLLEKSHDIEPARLARSLARQRLDGVILPPPFCDSGPLIAALHAAHIPTALLATAAEHEDAFIVSIDDEAAARDMTEHLLQLGHRRIGFVLGNPNQTASERRRAGYLNALRRAGIEPDPALIAQGDFTYQSGLRAARTLLSCAPRPTAIFASNDDMAAGAVAAAHALHLETPAQLSVCGFDDTALAQTILPELTTIRQPVAAMAQEAVAMLTRAHRAKRQGGAPAFERKLLSHQLIRRDSDAPPAR